MKRLAALAVSFVGALLVAPTIASAQSASVTVGDAAEAWYQTGLLGSCSSPVGCPPVSTTGSYPANTLHVGVTAGQTTAVTYVQPDLSDLPAGDTATGGIMTLPLATVANNGNENPSSAAIEACLATGPFTDGTDGSGHTPPSTDCSVHSTVAVCATAFTLNLGPFITAWSSGRRPFGIALLPDPAGVGPTSSWQVSFNGRRLSGASHISSALTVSAPEAPASAPAAPSQPGPGTIVPPQPSASSAAAASGAASGVPVAAAPSQPAIAEPPVTAPASAPGASSPIASAGSGIARIATSRGGRGFQYPEVMLLPLAFAAGLVFVARVLTSDATPERRSA